MRISGYIILSHNRMGGFIAREHYSQLQTDSDGVVTVRIPARLLDNKTAKIEIGFWNFPVVKE